MAIRDYRRVKAWQASHDMTLKLFALTRHLPAEEKDGLSRQIRSLATRMSSSLLQACEQDTNALARPYVQISMDVAFELTYLLLVAHELGYVEANIYEKIDERFTDAKRLISGFLRQLD